MYEIMIQLYQKIKQLSVLKLYLENPYDSYYLRESARLLKMDPMTVKRALTLFVADGIVLKTKEKNQILYKANIESPAVRYLKISYNIATLLKKKVVECITNNMNTVTSILLFGSYAKGENDSESDIDILVLSLSKNPPTAELTKVLKRDVNLIYFTPAQWSQQAKTNRAFYLDVIIDGIVLYGTKPVVE
jgi:predicted nucleotidyltransferase